MAIFRRPRRAAHESPRNSPARASYSPPAHLVSAELVDQNIPEAMQRALTSIVAISQQLDSRLTRLESQLAHLNPRDLGLASQEDLDDLRSENSRLSGELAKATIDLRERIDLVEFNAPTSTAHNKRVSRLAEQILDLSDKYNA